MQTVIIERKGGNEVHTFQSFTQAEKFMRANRHEIMTTAPAEKLAHRLSPVSFVMGHKISEGIFTYDTSNNINGCLMASIYNNGTYGQKFLVVYKRTAKGIKVMYGGEWFEARNRQKIPV